MRWSKCTPRARLCSSLKQGLATDLLITDHAMPGMTGVELAREVRRQRPQLPILLATGLPSWKE